MVKKASVAWRLTVDYHRLNAMPDIITVTETVAAHTREPYTVILSPHVG